MLAKEFSQDSESAKKGGDLGYFSRGMMVKEFEDVVFKLKKNQLSGIVETEYGYHIIMLTIKLNPMDTVRSSNLKAS